MSFNYHQSCRKTTDKQDCPCHSLVALITRLPRPKKLSLRGTVMLFGQMNDKAISICFLATMEKEIAASLAHPSGEQFLAMTRWSKAMKHKTVIPSKKTAPLKKGENSVDIILGPQSS